MRYYSQDRNCCIDTGQNKASNLAGVPAVRADITIRYPCLVRIRLEPRKNEFIVRSRLSGKDVCSFPRDELDQDESRGIDLALLHGLTVKLLQDVKEDNESASELAENDFHIVIPDSHCVDTSSQDLHPDVEALLADVVSWRKRQDDLDLMEYQARKRADFAEFEARVSTQAETLSGLVIESWRADERRKTSRHSRDSDSSKEGESARRLSNNSSQSTSSTASRERVRKRSNRGSKEVTPPPEVSIRPKPALVTPLRKASMIETSRKDGSSPVGAAKRVMFSEKEPTRIASDHLQDASETEDDEVIKKPLPTPEADELFAMDESISTMPHSRDVSAAPDIVRTRSQGPFSALSFEDLDYRSEPSRRQSELQDTNSADDDTFSTSLPRPIAKGPTAYAAPLSSIKDIPSLSPIEHDDLESPLGDSPPAGVSRKTMWKQAVASSLRMSGLLLPTLSREELDAPLITDVTSPQKLRV